MDNLMRTPLFQEHINAGGQMVDFGGWAMPLKYSGILEEVEAVRSRAGLFDVSHMGEITVAGPQALSWLDTILTNDIRKLADNQVMYAFMCYPHGGVVDDLLVYRHGLQKFLLVVNAANTQKDWDWLTQHKVPGVVLENISPDMGQLAVQGPLAEEILQKLTPYKLEDIGFFRFASPVEIAGIPALVSRTGYTGEDGFEIYCPAADSVRLWQEIMREGKPLGLLPCGLGARDTLRFEAGLPLYGHEISQEITPLEARLGLFVKLKKEADFIGKAALAALKEKGLSRQLAGLTLVDKGVPRAGYPVYNGEGKEVGYVTSGSFSPTLNASAANALVAADCAREGTYLWIGVRQRRLQARVTKLPFYKREAK